LAEAGFEIDGVDYSSNLLTHAKRRGEGRQLRYAQGDMRALPSGWTMRFDAVINVYTSFGFFVDPADDRTALQEFARVLKRGGILVWHGASRDGVVARFLAKDWWRTSDGTVVAQHRSFDPLSGLLTVESEWRGGSAGDGRGGARADHSSDGNERSYRLRLYTATQLAELCRAVGLIVESAYDGWNPRPLRRTSSEMLLVARKHG
jgi:SAM-dependent methyltransferase